MVPIVKFSKLKTKSKGQAAIEYVLVTLVASVVFLAMFGVIRRSLFYLWICDLAPRIQAAIPCGDDTDQCWGSAGGGQVPGIELKPQACMEQ